MEITFTQLIKFDKAYNMKRTFFIFHGTEGHPRIHWLGWLRDKLVDHGHEVLSPQFPSPPIVPSKIDEWHAVFSDFSHRMDENSVIIGHSLGGLFALRVLEAIECKVHTVAVVASPVGIKPIQNYPREIAFCGYKFDWVKIRKGSSSFLAFYGDDDPYVSIGNGELVAEMLNAKLEIVANAGHFNTDTGYTEFELLWERLKPLIEKQ